MSSLLSRFSFRETRTFAITCGVIFMVMLAVLLRWKRPVKDEHAIAKKQEHVALMKARGEPVPTSALPKIEHYVAVWLRKGWLLNTGLVGALLLASPLLGRRRRKGMKFLSEPDAPPMRWPGYAAIVVLMLLAAWQNYPRLFLSMWGDEEFNASRFIVDEVTRDDAGEVKIAPRPWSTTLWSFRKTTNHLGFTALARFFHDTFFQKKTGPHDPWFSEALIRLPVFLAGLLFIPAMFWCGRVWRVPMELAVIVGILHPWFLRYGVDGRAYGLVMLAVPVMLGLLGRALQTGRWMWWLLLSAAEFSAFWCYFGSIYLLVALNLAALGLVFTGVDDKESCRLLLGRWFVSGTVAAMLVIGVMAPCLPQLFEFLDQKPISGRLDGAWWRDSMSELFFGAPWSPQHIEGDLEMAMTKWPGAVMSWINLAGVAAVFVCGAFFLAVCREQRGLLVIALLAPALMLAHMAHSGVRPYAWYLMPYFPLMLLVLGSFIPWETNKPERWLGAVALAVFPWFCGLHARTILRNHPVEQSRESVALYRNVTNPRNADIDKEVISGGFVYFTEGYDPAMHRFKDAAGLRALMEEADRTKKKLFVNVGHIEFGRETFADVCRLIEDPAQFEHVGHLPGLFFSTTRDVFRYKGVNGIVPR